MEIKTEKAKGDMISVLLTILKIRVRNGRDRNSSGSFTGEKEKSPKVLFDLQKVTFL